MLDTIFHHLQCQLFPTLTAELGPLSALDQPFCQFLALTELGRFTRRYEWCGNGKPPCPRVWLAHAFIAKHVYQFPTTGALRDALRSRPRLRQLCGWDSAGEIPSESTFSRAFTAFAKDQLPQQIHEHRVKPPLQPFRCHGNAGSAQPVLRPRRRRRRRAPVPEGRHVYRGTSADGSAPQRGGMSAATDHSAPLGRGRLAASLL